MSCTSRAAREGAGGVARLVHRRPCLGGVALGRGAARICASVVDGPSRFPKNYLSKLRSAGGGVTPRRQRQPRNGGDAHKVSYMRWHGS